MNNRNPTWKDGAGPEGAGRSRLRHAAAALAVAFAGVFAVPTIADAATLVSNSGQTTSTDLGLSLKTAQSFTTGLNDGGYSLTGVDLYLRVGTNASVEVRILNDNSGLPGTTRYTLVNPVSFSTSSVSKATFSAPTNSTLVKDTTYWVEIEATSGTVGLGRTTSTSEDSGGEDDWSIADTRLFINNAGDNYTSTSFSGWLMRLTVEGTEDSGTNTAPTASDGEVETNEDTDYAFEASDFNFADTDTGDTLSSVKITSLPGSGKGSLELDGTTITTTPQTVTKTQLDDGDLVYSPPANANGNDYTTFKFKVNDGDDDSTAEYTMTIDVEAVNDAPVVDNAIPDQAATEDSAFSYAFPANTFSDVDDTSLEYSATKGDGTDLPSWLTFTESTRTFSGTPGTSDIGTLSVKVEAEDDDNDSVTDTFDIVVSAADTTAPRLATISLHTPSSSPTSADSLTWRVTFSEDVKDVDGADFAAAGTTATLSVAAVGTSKSQYYVTAAGGDLASLDGIVSLALRPVFSTINDLADNRLTNTLATGTVRNTYRVDNTAPTITSIERHNPTAERTNADSLTWRITFSEDVKGLSTDDFYTADLAARRTAVADVTGVAAVGTSKSIYDVTASGGTIGDYNGQISLEVIPSDDMKDLADNALTNTTPTGANQKYTLENAGPTFSSAAINGATLVITFNEDLGTASGLVNTAFTVKKDVGGTATVQTLTGTPSIFGVTVTLTLSTAVTSTDSDITVAYTKPGSGTDNRIRDTLGNETATFGDEEVTNKTGTTDTTAPTVTSIERQDPSSSPTNSDTLKWRVTFSEDVQNVGTGDFSVSGTSATVTAVTGVSGSESQYDVTASGGDLANYNGTATLSIASGHNITDKAIPSNALTNTTAATSESYVVDNAAPTFSSAAINGATLVITFNENLLTTSTLRTDDFEVTKGASDTVQSLTGTPSITGKTVTLTLSTPVTSTDTDIKVDYTRPALLLRAIQDTVGNRAATFDDEDVTNNTTATCSDSTAIWCATLTVQPTSGGVIGCRNGTICGTALTDNDFTHDSVDYSISKIQGNVYPQIALNPNGQMVFNSAAFTLHIGDGEYSFADATYSSGDFEWRSSAALSWSSGDSVDLKITHTPTLPATGKPAISGRAQAGHTLTAGKGTIRDASGTSMADNGDAGFAYTYQWVRVDGMDETDISGATSGTYTLQDADAGKTIKVKVSFTDDDNNPEGPLTSDAYPSAGNVKAAENATGMPSITGTAALGQTLTATKGTISDTDGTTKADNADAGFAYTYQWVRVDGMSETDIKDATSSTYTLAGGDFQKKIKVKVSFVDDAGTPEGPLTSAAFPTTGSVACLDDDALWCATLTVKNLSSSGKGCNRSLAARYCSSALSVRNFTYGSTNYSVHAVVSRRTTAGTMDEFDIQFDPNGSTVFNSGDYTLHVGGTELSFGDATYSTTAQDFAWDVADATFDWSANDEIELKITKSVVTDTMAPTVTDIERQEPDTSPTNSDTLKWRVTFSEDVQNVDTTDFSVSGTTGTVTAVAGVSGSERQYDVTASGGDLANYDGTVTLSFASGQNITDKASTPNDLSNTTPTGTNDNTYVLDNTAPTFSSAAINGTSLVITFNEDLDTSSTPPNSAFTVKKDVGGTATEQTLAGTPSVSGKTVTLALSTAVTSTDTDIKVKYTKPGSGTDNRIRDALGNETATFDDDEDVTNNTTATNTAPTASDGEVETNEDTDYTFAASDFNFADTDTGDALASVKITSLPGTGKGELKLDGTAIASGDLPKTVTKAELDGDDLVYSPPANASGDDYTTFKFKVNDGEDDSAAEYTMTIDVKAVNDAPVVDNAIPDQAATAGSAFSYAFPENTFSDVDDTALDYSATKGDDTDLPSWLTFTESTRTFSGTPTVSDIGTLSVKVEAEDGDGDSVTDTFDIVVSPTITIAANHETVPLGHHSRVEKLTFTVTRTGPTTDEVEVPVTPDPGRGLARQHPPQPDRDHRRWRCERCLRPRIQLVLRG